MGLSEQKDERAKKAAEAIAEYVHMWEVRWSSVSDKREKSQEAAFEKMVDALRGLA